MENKDNSCLLIFVKYPKSGNVKSRLARDIGPESASQIYNCFVLDLLEKIRNQNICMKICYDPGEPLEKYKGWLGNHYIYMPQKGNDLGQRMSNSFQTVFNNGFNEAVLIGSDSPDLPEEYIKSAFELLEYNDAVIGPSSDGGYYLIGFTRKGLVPESFNDISWGTNNVCSLTIKHLKSKGCRLSFLPEWYDIDTLEDLNATVIRNRNTSFCNSKTYDYILKIQKEQ